MSLSEQMIIDLLAYADGELEGDAKKRIEAIIARDEEARAIVASASLLSDAVQHAEAARPVSNVADSIVDNVMSRVANERIGFLDASMEPKAKRLRRAAPVAVLSTVLALAAGWFLFMRGPEVIPGGIAKVIDSANVDDRDISTGPEGVELESADSPVSVFLVSMPSDDLNKKAVSSVVVWLGGSDSDSQEDSEEHENN